MSKVKDIDSRTICIQLIDGSKINGQLNLNRKQGYDRISDLVSSGREPFLVVFNATLYEHGLENPIKHQTIFVNKDQIVFATPDGTQY